MVSDAKISHLCRNEAGGDLCSLGPNDGLATYPKLSK